MKTSVLQKAKGVRDFGPQEKMERDLVVSLLKENFEKYGFNPIETPIIERYELLASKYGQGIESDSMKETFKLQDQGGRDLVLRNEFTVPLARFIGENQALKMPFKRYQLGQIFRDGPLKLGRYREFWQADVDIVGVGEVVAEAELLCLTQEIFDRLDLSIKIQLNNRKFLNFILNKFGVQQKLQSDFIISIDKLEKIGEGGVLAELKEKGVDETKSKEILKLLRVSGSNSEIIQELRQQLGDFEGLLEIEKLLSMLPETVKVSFVPSLARGLAYYTGSVFEVFLADKDKLSCAVAGGGRYDEMIGGFIGQEKALPAVGISFGLDTIMEAKKQLGKITSQNSVTQVFVASIGVELSKVMQIVQEIRKAGLKVDFDMQNRKLKKNFEYVDSLNIPYMVIVGEDELRSKKLTLRDMKTGVQKKLTLAQLAKSIKI